MPLQIKAPGPIGKSNGERISNHPQDYPIVFCTAYLKQHHLMKEMVKKIASRDLF